MLEEFENIKNVTCSLLAGREVDCHVDFTNLYILKLTREGGVGNCIVLTI